MGFSREPGSSARVLRGLSGQSSGATWWGVARPLNLGMGRGLGGDGLWAWSNGGRVWGRGLDGLSSARESLQFEVLEAQFGFCRVRSSAQEKNVSVFACGPAIARGLSLDAGSYLPLTSELP